MSEYSEDEYDDYGDESFYSGEDVSEEYVGGDMDGQAEQAEQADDYDPREEEHVDHRALIGVQTKKFIFRAKGTLEQFARRDALTRRRLHERGLRHLKQVTSMTDRSNPTEENTLGNTDRIIPLAARLVHRVNTVPRTLGWQFNKKVLAPQTITDEGKCFTDVLEARTPAGDSDWCIFYPNNIFAQRMLEKWERCDQDSVEDEFIFKKISGKEACLVRVKDDETGKDSVAITLLKNYNHLFPSLNAREVMRSKLPNMPYAPIPVDVGHRLRDHMKSEIAKIAASFISGKDLTVDFFTEDGQPWNQVSNLVGEAAAIEPGKQGEHKNIVLNTQYEAAVHIEMKFIPVP